MEIVGSRKSLKVPFQVKFINGGKKLGINWKEDCEEIKEATHRSYEECKFVQW